MLDLNKLLEEEKVDYCYGNLFMNDTQLSYALIFCRINEDDIKLPIHCKSFQGESIGELYGKAIDFIHTDVIYHPIKYEMNVNTDHCIDQEITFKIKDFMSNN